MWPKSTLVCVCSPWFAAPGCCWVQQALQKRTIPPALVLFCPRCWKARYGNQSLTASCSLFTRTRDRRGRNMVYSITRTDTELTDNSRKKLPRVCWPTEHLTAVFDDVLVAVGVLDSVLSRPGSFDLVKTKKHTTLSMGTTNFPENHQPTSQTHPDLVKISSLSKRFSLCFIPYSKA